jgi:succinate dehydrogenase/fumarate reductase flavoprotein subunit
LNAEDVTCDLLVAGSGAAGFATALTAHLQGLDVIMVEKAPLFGGRTAYSAGVVWIPITAAQPQPASPTRAKPRSTIWHTTSAIGWTGRGP